MSHLVLLHSCQKQSTPNDLLVPPLFSTPRGNHFQLVQWTPPPFAVYISK
jgi:hypothetical protein